MFIICLVHVDVIIAAFGGRLVQNIRHPLCTNTGNVLSSHLGILVMAPRMILSTKELGGGLIF